ncbi:acyl carrier protein [Aurantibacillus circumpalustris]|uniref:acyl carrier protein n=1 Tax=Aurantibacillus circumpalustris TaxID=3036359 RepID=UPI00295A5C0A|nr:acyl carrier protein [Aurantibacillus circumpalustris]
MKQHHEKLTQVFRSVFKNDAIEITDSTNASDIDQWDSITHLDLITAVEEAFAIEITGFDVMGLKNVGDLLDLIQRKIED